MKVNIKDRVVGPKQTFRIKIEWMFGDADWYKTTVVDTAAKFRLEEKYATILEEMRTTFAHGRSCGERYSKEAPHLAKYFGEEETNDEDIYIEIPCDEYGCEGDVDSIKVTYFDIQSNEHKCEIVE